MSLLNKLTLKNLKLNKKRTVVTIIGIILSVALISALSCLVVSFKSSMIDYEITNTGNFHSSFSNLTESDLTKFKNNRQIESVYFTKEVGYALIDEIKNEDKPYAYIMAFDYDALNDLGLKLVEGRLPQTSKEIVIPRHLKTNGRVELKVGDTISLCVGSRLTEDGYTLDQSNPFIQGSETFKEEIKQEYKIVGIIERPSYKIENYSSPGYTFITCLDTIDEGVYNAYVRYTKDVIKDNYLKAIANILGVDVDLYLKVYGSIDESEEYLSAYTKLQEQLSKTSYNVSSSNTSLISLEGGKTDDPTMRALMNVAFVVVIIIIVTSVFCIKNSFAISITEKTKQYGMLASVGSTKKQIKKNVLYEAFILGLIGIPLGILGGILAGYILIIVCNHFLSGALNMNLTFDISIISIILSILLGAITIYLSAISSAKKASKISPISAIRSNDDIKIKSKKVKSPKIIKKLFGIGGEVSYKNLKRNRKKYRTTVVSIIVCVSVFIALYYFMSMGFKTVELQYGEYNYNIVLSVDVAKKEESDALQKQILEVEGNNRYTFAKSFLLSITNPKLSEEQKKLLASYYTGDTYQEYLEEMTIEIVSLGNEEYNRYLKTLGINSNNMVNKGILINNDVEYYYDDEAKLTKKVEIPFFTYKVGEKISGTSHITSESGISTSKVNYEIEIGAITYERPLGLENDYGIPYIIVSDEEINKIIENHSFEFAADYNDADKAQDELEKILDNSSINDYYLTNVDNQVSQIRSLYTLIAIFLYGFITVIALIGITNIFNTITTNMELRSREFAMLKSVGMTKKEFNRMVRLESLFYGTKSLIIGIPIGCILSYLLYKTLMGGELEFAYSLPIGAIIISIIAVYLLVLCIMKFSITKISKQNTIETIRNDNI